MSDLSLWDTYRTVAPLYSWLVSRQRGSQARSLVAFGNGLGAYPKWPLAIGETGTMLGASAEIVYADAVARGVRGVDPNAAYPMLRAAAMDAGRRQARRPRRRHGLRAVRLRAEHRRPLGQRHHRVRAR